jgi:hypothetical protein
MQKPTDTADMILQLLDANARKKCEAQITGSSTRSMDFNFMTTAWVVMLILRLKFCTSEHPQQNSVQNTSWQYKQQQYQKEYKVKFNKRFVYSRFRFL